MAQDLKTSGSNTDKEMLTMAEDELARLRRQVFQSNSINNNLALISMSSCTFIKTRLKA